MGTDDFERMRWSWYYHHTVQTPSAASAKTPAPGKMGNPKDDLMPMNDPVNPQPQGKNPTNTSEDTASQEKPSSVGKVSHQQASSDATGKDDPVNPQEHTSKSDANDPVYAQPQPSLSSSQGPSHTTASGNAVTTDDPTYTQQHGTATSRLQQVSSHISSSSSSSSEPSPANTRRSRKKARDAVDSLPEDYSDIIEHITTMKRIAATPDTSSRGYIRQKAAGKLWARERISALLDPSTWREVGALSGSTDWRRDPSNPRAEHVSTFLPTNNPQGFGQLTCPLTGQKREVYLTVDDFSLRAGHADGGNTLKTLYGEKLAYKLKTPVVKLCDGSSGGGSVTTITKQGYAYLPHNIILWPAALQLNSGIPNLGAVLGTAIGLGFARVVSTHFSVMAADIGSCFNAGPKVVEGATFEEGLSFQELGGPMVHCTNGTIDNMAANEDECFVQIRTVLGYLPDCGEIQAPPCSPCSDDVNREDIGLRSIIPRRKERGYNPSAIIASVVDKGSWFEIGQLWGRTSIVGLARLGGRPVGIMSNNCEVNSGALDPAGSQKMMKHLKFCDVFNLPILQFVDVPGYAIGTVAERSGTMKWGVELAKAYYTTTTPIFSVMMRRSYGVAGGVMVDSRDPIFRIAWPSANWGSLPLDGGIEVGHRHELNQIREKEGEEGWKRRYKELEDEYLRLMNPVRTANVFNVEDIVDPKDTRAIACRWAGEMYGKVMAERMADRVAKKIHPVFS